MLLRTKLQRSEHLPVIGLAIAIVFVIHISGKIDQFTANQYVLEDNDRTNQSCLLYPSTLQGRKQQIDMSSNGEWAHIEHVQPGGIFSPSDCTPRQQLALIIPYRNREYHLKLLLRNLHPFLQRQKRAYQIFVVEQLGNVTFNKGVIMNIAFDQARKLRSTFDCFIFHDVDLLPENDLNVYECDQRAPRHLSPAVDELRYILMYDFLVGGVLAMTKEQFLKVNGWSNLYWGWGAEDDDMSQRIKNASYRVSRPPNHIGRYKMIRHEKRERAVNRYELFQGWLRYPQDGIKQLNELDYTVVAILKQSLFTHILVNFTRSSTRKLEHLLR